MANQSNTPPPKPARFLAKAGKWLISLISLGILGIAGGYLYLSQELPDIAVLKDVQFQVPLRIVTQDQKLIAEFGDKRRNPVPISDIPPLLIQAILATEDQRFYKHPGIDPIGLSRAVIRLLASGEKEEGGSTITMQVARNFFLTRKKDFSRKFKEILLAIKIDKELSKEKILELYLNKIYFGNRAYGVAAAAQVYYGKPLNQLTLAQYAMLAGLPKAPSMLNPIINPEAALKRREHVLSRMLQLHYIDTAQYAAANSEPVAAKYHGLTSEVNAPYLAEMVRSVLLAQYGSDIYTMGLIVTTTINSNLQETANRSLHDGLLAYSERHGYYGPEQNWGTPAETLSSSWQSKLAAVPEINGLLPAAVINVGPQSLQALLANGKIITIEWPGLSWARRVIDAKSNLFAANPLVASDIVKPGDLIRVRLDKEQWRLTQVPLVQGAEVAMNPHNGAILALSGGFSFNGSNFNRAIQAQRQPGSAFKPFLYSAALDKGLTLATVINDSPIVIDDASQEDEWRPKNDNRRFYGPTRLRYALSRSRNLVSIRLLDLIGIPFARDYVQRFGFSPSQLPETLSLALGSGSTTPLQLTEAYAVFANGGYKITPYFIDSISNTRQELLYKAHPPTACASCKSSDPALSDAKEETPAAPHVITAQNAYLITSAMQDVIKMGTGRQAAALHRRDLAGKTGTTNDQVDAWFAGFNPDLVMTVWVGFDNPQSLYEYGAEAALPIWIDFMQYALQHYPERSSPQPHGIVSLRINKETGLPASAADQNTLFELFEAGHVPSNTSTANPNGTVIPSAPSNSTVEELF
ncbi:MAG: peptidase [Gammaproteobacteria bacterium]|jgi:penicillin-binding protein 1A|nr:peptidase [Gammaproteobacteria bacterium]